MFSIGRLCLRYRTVHPRAAVSVEAQTAMLRQALVSKTLQKPVILDDLDTDVVGIAPLPSPAAQSSSSPPSPLTARQLWNSTCVARENKHVRRTQGTCVVGGAKAIRRIWREYKIAPLVVYVPNTEANVPAWCLEDDLPSYIVRCSPVSIKKQLLSAEFSDGYAAEFPWNAEERMPPVTSLFPDDVEGTVDVVRSMLVLVGLRIPSNVGMLLRAAVEMGFENVLLVNCVDPFQEKVVRASEGKTFAPQLRIFELPDSASCVSLLSGLARRHRLLPLLAIPSQDAEPAFDVAKRFHAHNAVRGGSPEGGALGPMLVLGSESQGLEELHGEWGTPYQVLTLPLPNPLIDSYNVTVAGSILLNLFRPAAQEHVAKLLALSGEKPADLVDAFTAGLSSSSSQQLE